VVWEDGGGDPASYPIRQGKMKKLHEIWIDKDGFPGCCFAGPEGDGFRKLLDQPAKKIHEFFASSHIEAMTYYYRYMAYGEYKSDFPKIDGKEYEELEKQRR
jgi:hypothetical protein